MVQCWPQLLRSHHVALRSAWLRRLSARPPVSALARVEILSHYMDESLRQLGDLLADPSQVADVSNAPEPLDGWRDEWPCGQNPLLDYYVTGGEALSAVLVGLSERERRRLHLCWLRMAREELEVFCKACCPHPTVCAEAECAN